MSKLKDLVSLRNSAPVALCTLSKLLFPFSGESLPSLWLWWKPVRWYPVLLPVRVEMWPRPPSHHSWLRNIQRTKTKSVKSLLCGSCTYVGRRILSLSSWISICYHLSCCLLKLCPSSSCCMEDLAMVKGKEAGAQCRRAHDSTHSWLYLSSPRDFPVSSFELGFCYLQPKKI